MFDRFTDRARKVMQLANLEALAHQHKHLGTEHLLLGLVKEGGGLAATALNALGVQAAQLQVEFEKVAPNGPAPVPSDKVPPSPDAKKAMVQAFEEVRKHKAGFVDTEHILLGLLAIPETKAVHILSMCGLDAERVSSHVVSLLHRNIQGPMDDPEDDDMSDDYDMRATVKRINPNKLRQQVILRPDVPDDELGTDPPAEPLSLFPPSRDSASRDGSPREASASLPSSPPLASPSNRTPPGQYPLPSSGLPPASPSSNLPSVSATTVGPGGKPTAGVPMPGAEIPSPQSADSAVRQALQLCWHSLPEPRKNIPVCSAEFRRLVERALRDFEEDMRAFGEK